MFQDILAMGAGGGVTSKTETFTTALSQTIPLPFEPSLVAVDITCATASRHNLYYWTADNNQTFVVANYKNAGTSATQLNCYNSTAGGIKKTSNGFSLDLIISQAEEVNRPAVYYAMG
jgi:hypothetical protein